MNLYIETENGHPKNHPAFEENLIQAFGEVPPNWVSFTRVEKPEINIYEVYEGVTYEFIGNAYTDVHHVRPMNDKEKQEAINEQTT